MDFYCFLYDRFETLDLFGPVEVFGRTKDRNIRFLSQNGGVIVSDHGVRVETEKAGSIPEDGVLVLPGGFGARTLIDDAAFLDTLRKLACEAQYVLSVCTGSALLAKCGVLDGKKATSNKLSFAWVKQSSSSVEWAGRARWVKDGKFYTASGISAGLDMALGFVADLWGEEEARGIANWLEYVWNSSSDNDPFAVD
jgi:putative intracellular protease/amidase